MFSRMRALSLQRRRTYYGFLFISPWLIGFILFTSGPMLASTYLSLTDYSLTPGFKFIGFENYVHALTRDRLFWGSLGRTFHFAFLVVAIGTCGSLGLAYLLDTQIRGKTLYRTLFFLPHLTPVVASAVLWLWLFSPDFGPVNYLLESIGVPGQMWFWSTKWAMPGMIIMSLWGSIGGPRMIIFLAGLQGVPTELYEAAEMDGAGQWRKFVNVTLPMISPALLFNLVLGIIGALKVFAAAFVTTQGGPNYATWFYALHIYTQAFKYYSMGYASALSWIFLLVVLILTLVQIKMSDRWVFYAGGQ